MGMSFGMGLAMIPAVLFMFLLPIALLVILQVWLCKKDVRLGLILPGISLVLSLMLTFSFVVYSAVTVGGSNLRVTDEYGNVVQEEVIPTPKDQKPEFNANTLIAAGVVFLVTNVPTVVFGGIWLHFKGRKDTLDDLKRMQIEDLE